MTVKKIHLNYQSHVQFKIAKLESNLTTSQRNLDIYSNERLVREETNLIRATKEEIEALKNELSNILPTSQYEPIAFLERRIAMLLGGDVKSMPKRLLYIYQDVAYEIKGNYSVDESKLLILEFVDKERQKFERLKKKFSQTDPEELAYERKRIPESVRIAVWRRDQGRCANCGSRENLEYDHIVPVSKGGSNTARNIELLCQDCNRAKGNRIE